MTLSILLQVLDTNLTALNSIKHFPHVVDIVMCGTNTDLYSMLKGSPCVCGGVHPTQLPGTMGQGHFAELLV